LSFEELEKQKPLSDTIAFKPVYIDRSTIVSHLSMDPVLKEKVDAREKLIWEFTEEFSDTPTSLSSASKDGDAEVVLGDGTVTPLERERAPPSTIKPSPSGLKAIVCFRLTFQCFSFLNQITLG
jgi:hypothetical protein